MKRLNVATEAKRQARETIGQVPKVRIITNKKKRKSRRKDQDLDVHNW